MFERPGSGSQAILVSLDFGEPDFAESTEELVQLEQAEQRTRRQKIAPVGRRRFQSRAESCQCPQDR